MANNIKNGDTCVLTHKDEHVFMTQEDIDMLKRAIDTHTGRLYKIASAHRENGNREQQKEYLVEMKRYNALKAKL